MFEYPLSAEKSVSIPVKTFFFRFWRSPVFGRKKGLIYRFWPKLPILAEKSVSISVKTFFLRSPVFGRKKGLNFRFFREIPSQVLDKPCDSDSRTMKIRVKVVCSFLTLSKKPLPFSNPGYAPDWGGLGPTLPGYAYACKYLVRYLNSFLKHKLFYCILQYF